jgi:integrase
VLDAGFKRELAQMQDAGVLRALIACRIDGKNPTTGRQIQVAEALIVVAAADYTGLAAKTKEGYDTALARIQGKFGTMPIVALEEKGARSVIRKWRDDVLAVSPRSADLTMAVFTQVLNFAKDGEDISRNPLDALTKLSSGTRKDIIWSDEQMALFAAVGPTHLVRAMILAKWTGQRQADLLKLSWDAYGGEYMRLQQGKAGRRKAGKRVKILASVELRLMLEEIRAEQKARSEHPNPRRRKAMPTTILTTVDGASWKSGFKASWGAAIKDAGITGVTFHDFRVSAKATPSDLTACGGVLAPWI